MCEKKAKRTRLRVKLTCAKYVRITVTQVLQKNIIIIQLRAMMEPERKINILVKILSAHIPKSEVAKVRVQGIPNRPRLNPNFKSVLGFDVVRDRIVA